MGEDQQRFRSRWAMVLESGKGQRLTLRANEPMWVTDVFLVDPAASAVGQGAVDACLKIGNLNIMLASLSAESPWEELHTLVMLDEKFLLYVMPRGGDSAADASDMDTDTDDAVVVQFEGFLLAPPSPESKHERGQEAMSSTSEDGGNRIDEKHAEEENNVQSVY